MAGGFSSGRLAAFVALGVAAAVLWVAALAPAGRLSAQMVDDRYPFLEERARRGGVSQPGLFSFPNLFGVPQETPRPVPENNAKAPPPSRKSDAPAPSTTIVVFGDSMADWLAYGLEIAAAESPDIAIVRRHRTYSGLIRPEAKKDPRGEHPDWPQLAREILNAEPADFVVMMIGLNDRRPIREMAAARNSARDGAVHAGAQAAHGSGPPAPSSTEPGAETGAGEIEGGHAGAGTVVHEFRSERWVELYTKRIDETIAALKSKNVPVYWVGLPPIRGPKASADLSYLNDLYKSRAEKAGITYVDTWDGFVDEAGRYVVFGPDFEGQTRRLRSGDGVHFTKAGARKLAHYVEREIQRVLMTRATPVSLPLPEEPALPPTSDGRPSSAAIARPLSGPAVPLTAAVIDRDELLGGLQGRPGTLDALAERVLVRGEPVTAPAGRADDYTWPRREIAPIGTDPVVATTTLPMTPMIAPEPERPAVMASPAEGAPGAAAAAARGRSAGSTRQAAAAGTNPGAPRPPGRIGTQQVRREPWQYTPFQSFPRFFFPFFAR